MNRMVTKGYRKGVYEWVTKGITGSVTSEGFAGCQLTSSPSERSRWRGGRCRVGDVSSCVILALR